MSIQVDKAEGVISIDLADFWDWVINESDYLNSDSLKVAFGVPRIDKQNKRILINFVASSLDSPHHWLEKPDCLNEWDE